MQYVKNGNGQYHITRSASVISFSKASILCFFNVEKKKGWTTECIIIRIISIKNHTNWLMPFGGQSV